MSTGSGWRKPSRARDAAGVRSVPTFIFDETYAIVGAQEYETFQSVMTELGREPRAEGEGP